MPVMDMLASASSQSGGQNWLEMTETPAPVSSRPWKVLCLIVTSKRRLFNLIEAVQKTDWLPVVSKPL